VSQVSLTTDSLVSTKLRPSQARPKLVARPRLIAKLERETGRKLTLISAPAGFGKTHVNNLYRKLDSHSRTQAVARARELKLL